MITGDCHDGHDCTGRPCAYPHSRTQTPLLTFVRLWLIPVPSTRTTSFKTQTWLQVIFGALRAALKVRCRKVRCLCPLRVHFGMN
jgi:hypothetical protein